MDSNLQNPPVDEKPQGRWAPISAWGYLGIFLLLCIPIVNLVLLIVWACGGCKKMNKTKMAQGLLLLFALFLLMGTLGIVMLVKTVKQILADSDWNIPALSEFSTTAKVLAEHGTELIQDIKTGDMNGMMEVWSSLDTEERTSLLDMAAENSSISQVIQGVTLPVPEDGQCYETEIACGSAEEFQGYIALAQSKGFRFEDYQQLGMSEPEAIENGYWFGSDGQVCVYAHYEGNTLSLGYLSHTTALGD